MPGFSKPDAKLDSWKMFNARCERLIESPVYRRLVNSRRCVVLLDGFYEWKAEKAVGKQPYYVHTGGVMFVAALYDVWVTADGEKHYTYAILTTDSCKSLQWLHDRMPVILTKDQAEAWLSSDVVKFEEVVRGSDKQPPLFRPCPPDLAWHAVDKRMTNMAYNEVDASDAVKPAMKDLASFFGGGGGAPSGKQVRPKAEPMGDEGAAMGGCGGVCVKKDAPPTRDDVMLPASTAPSVKSEAAPMPAVKPEVKDEKKRKAAELEVIAIDDSDDDEVDDEGTIAVASSGDEQRPAKRQTKSEHHCE